MPPQRPTAMFVFGILNLVFGTIFSLGSCCCGAAFGVVYVGMREIFDQAAPADQAEFEQLWAEISEAVPGILPVLTSMVAAFIVLSLMQFLSGIGMVMIRGWGRWLCVIWALLTIAGTLGSTFYQLTILGPGVEKTAEKSLDKIERLIEKIEEKQRKMGQAPQQREKLKFVPRGQGDMVADNVAPLIFSGVVVLYAGLALLFMLLPGTGEAIARYHGQGDYRGSGRQDDMYDDDYTRRRRDKEDLPPPTDMGPPGM